MLEKAVELRASDIHIEPFRTGLAIRMRVDGLLRAMPVPSGVPPQALISRVKILAGLNIAERRLPQDGAARIRVSRAELDVRVATVPTQAGESAVIRLLPRDRGLLEMGKLGLSSRDEEIMTRLLALPHGMIVVTGPTGSGKTTTLATMLSILNEPTRKILTIEDPVEYVFTPKKSIFNQREVGNDTLAFHEALRNAMRCPVRGERPESPRCHRAVPWRDRYGFARRGRRCATPRAGVRRTAQWARRERPWRNRACA
jgi:type II secretory ATPase GspE/PulE/Tfp pilus assembly ATPase PilB-like protein